MSSHDPQQDPKKPSNSTGGAGGDGSHTTEQTRYVYEFSDFRLDPEGAPNYRLMRNGQPYKIQDMPFRLLRLLAENHGRELTNEKLIRLLWPEEAAAAASNPASFVTRLHTQVYNLRQEFGGGVSANKTGG